MNTATSTQHKPLARKAVLSTIELDRQEGIRAQWKASTFSGANRVLREWAETVAPGPGYDKVAVTVTWANGCRYDYRLDLKHPSSGEDEPNIEADLKQAIAFILGRAPHPDWSDKQYELVLKRYRLQGMVNLLEAIEQTCALGDLPEDTLIPDTCQVKPAKGTDIEDALEQSLRIRTGAVETPSVFAPDLGGYAAQAAARVLVDNWKAALRDGNTDNLLKDVDEVVAALQAFKLHVSIVLPAVG